MVVAISSTSSWNVSSGVGGCCNFTYCPVECIPGTGQLLQCLLSRGVWHRKMHRCYACSVV